MCIVLLPREPFAANTHLVVAPAALAIAMRCDIKDFVQTFAVPDVEWA
jgi:hypothetical protein